MAERYPGYPPTMAVNVSRRQLLGPEAVGAVHAALRRCGPAPADLLLELTEGVERPDQVAELVALGCGTAQGYHFARPLTPEAVDALLAATAREGRVSVPGVPRAPRSALWSASHPCVARVAQPARAGAL